jgi:hypothetical protein
MGTNLSGKEPLWLYKEVQKVPENAIKKITGGRLNGMSDINPMWRIKTLTENFGACGFGWKYEIVEQRLEKGGKDEIAAFVTINLFIRVDDIWSDAIPGVGGSSFVTLERNGLYTSDECFKMALTDALSVSCKALGVGADVYFEKDKTKYSQNQPENIPMPARDPDLAISLQELKECKTIDELEKVVKRWPKFIKDNTFLTVGGEMKAKIQKK